MSLDTIYESLCYYDSRNPDHVRDEDGDVAARPKKQCFCDNCFYGRTPLALHILNLQNRVDTLEFDGKSGDIWDW